MKATILLIGTLDTKETEFAYVRDLIQDRGHQVLMMDVGILSEPSFVPEITAETVAEAAGTSLSELREQADRGVAVQAMSQGATELAQKLQAAGKIDGVLSLGGSGGTSIATTAMRALPVGFPKVMVSTLASGNVAPYVGVKDVTMIYSVVDIAGLNRISRHILANAVGAICGMVVQTVPVVEDKPLLAATMFGVTTPCVTMLREQLEAAGYEVLVFHATGSGGQAMESLIAAGFIDGVADVTTTEWGDELIGGILSAGPHRLEAAGKTGIPQVVSVGALDMVNFAEFSTVPLRFSDRLFYKHNEQVTLMRTTPAENMELGRIIAKKLNQTTGPTSLFLPLKGISMIDADGQPFYDPAADEALFNALRQHLSPAIDLVELDLHINDPAFAQAMADRLLALLNAD